MARQLIQQLSDAFDPSEFKDEYRKALKKLINKKVKGEDIVIPETAEEPERVVDLMEALKASVEAARRGEKPKPSTRKKVPSESSEDGLSALTKSELDKRAKKLGISGRSSMAKKELDQGDPEGRLTAASSSPPLPRRPICIEFLWRPFSVHQG
jgi:DNA end-binding protein Ku